MKIGEYFPTKYLAAADLGGREYKLRIKSVETEQMRDGTTKPIVYFMGAEKGLTLNKTNANVISDMYGDDTDGWTGKEVTLYPCRVDFQGKRVDAIRVKFIQPPPRRTAVPLQPTQPQHDDRNPPPHDHLPASADMNDEIPFS